MERNTTTGTGMGDRRGSGNAKVKCAGVHALVLLLAPCSLLLSSCSSFDRTFRSRVSDVKVSLEGTYTDRSTNQSAGGALTADFQLRDPSKDGTAK